MTKGEVGFRSSLNVWSDSDPTTADSDMEEIYPAGTLSQYGKMVVTYHNDLNKTTLGMMSAQEQAVFFALCGRIKGRQREKMTVTFKEIEEMIGGNKIGASKIQRIVDGVASKLIKMSVYMADESGERLVHMNMFSTFIIDTKEKNVKMRVNSDFLYILNNISGNYTSFKLVNMLEIKGKYTRSMYRLLKQFEGTGVYRVSMDKFRTLVGIPDTFTTKNINQRVINPAIESLKVQFPNLKCTQDSKGATREVTHLTFTFHPTLTKDLEFEAKVAEMLVGKYS